MSALAVARRVRASLGVVAALRAAAWAVAAALVVMAALAVADLVVALPFALRRADALLGGIGGVAAAAWALWRTRHARSLRRVALWVEERLPLHYAFVTGVERELAGVDAPTVAVPGWSSVVRRSGGRALVAPLAAIGGALVVLGLVPAGTRGRVAAPRHGDALERRGFGAAPARSRLEPLVVRVVAPRYAAIPDSAFDEPSTVRALVGSTMIVEGRGAADGVVALWRAAGDTALARPLAVGAAGDRWRATLVVGPRAGVVRLGDGTHQRLVVVEPIVDAAPRTALLLPAHDSVIATPRGALSLAAEASDDHGLADGRFELIVSSGEGETFTFRSTVLGARLLAGRSGRLEATLSLDSLALAPGAVLHLRAVARDRDDVSGPNVGASETRVLRVLRTGENDSVAVDAAPPPEQQSVISERMLIMLAEALEKRRARTSRDRVIAESRAIASDQKALRREVGSIVFARAGGGATGEEVDETAVPANLTPEQLLAKAEEATSKDQSQAIDFEGGEAPVVAINRPLLEAYNAMWDAGTELELGEPGRALPHMRRALDAIQRARAAERVYLRGRVPAAVVDVAAARLKGKERGEPAARTPRPPADQRRAEAERRFSRAVDMVAARDPAAVDSLLLLRVESLADAPRFADALGDAATALRRGDARRAGDALARARRELAGAPVVADSLGSWTALR